MTRSHREFLLDLFTGAQTIDNTPESLASDEEAVDLLFYLLHEQFFPAKSLIEFLGKHRSDDRRFKLWVNRAFRPVFGGEDGMESLAAFRYLEKWNPDHPLLNPFMHQAAYSFECDIDFILLGSDFKRHLKSRYSMLIGDPQSGGNITQQIAGIESNLLERIAGDTAANLKERLAALDELTQRDEFDCFFQTDLPYQIGTHFIEWVKRGGTPAVFAAARRALLEKIPRHIAFEVLLAPKISASEFLELLESARRINSPSRSLFLDKIMEPDCDYPEELIRNTAMIITRDFPYLRYYSIPFLLNRFRHDAAVITLIKTCAAEESNDNKFSQILTELLNHGIEREWVRSSALAFCEAHDDCSSTIQIFGRIGDIESSRVILNALENPIPWIQGAAIDAAGSYLYDNPKVKTALKELARAGNVAACEWIIRHYPEDAETQEILGIHLEGKEANRYCNLILMCLQGIMQGIMLPIFRERLIRWLREPTYLDGFRYTALLAIRTEREHFHNEISIHWENLIIDHHRYSSIYLMWYPVEPLAAAIIERIRKGDFLKHPRELLFQLSDHADLAEALMDGIIAAAPREELADAILMLGLLYGHRPETVRFMKSFVDLDPTQRKYDSGAAFGEALRLGKRDEEDFEWAVALMTSSSQVRYLGIAHYGPRLFALSFGLTPAVRSALEIFAHRDDTNPDLADSSIALLREKFPGYSSREAVSLMSADRRTKHLRQLADAKSPQISELKYFALNDPVAEVRKIALGQIRRFFHCKPIPEEFEIAGFALECLSDGELAGFAAELLAKCRPQDEQVANQLLSAHARFPDAGIIVPLAESFGELPAVRSAVYEFIGACRETNLLQDPIQGFNRRVFIGFDLKIYNAVMVLLHSPPFREDHEAKFLRKDILTDRWIEPGWQMVKILNAETEALDQSERSAFLERIARSDALPPFRDAACTCLARMADKEDEPLERLLTMMRGDDMELKKLAKNSCSSIGCNSRRYHRELQTLLKS